MWHIFLIKVRAHSSSHESWPFSSKLKFINLERSYCFFRFSSNNTSHKWSWNLHYCCNIYLIKFVEVNIGRSQCLCRLGRDKQNNQDPEIERPIESAVPNLCPVQKIKSTNLWSEFRKKYIFFSWPESCCEISGISWENPMTPWLGYIPWDMPWLNPWLMPACEWPVWLICWEFPCFQFLQYVQYAPKRHKFVRNVTIKNYPEWILLDWSSESCVLGSYCCLHAHVFVNIWK